MSDWGSGYWSDERWQDFFDRYPNDALFQRIAEEEPAPQERRVMFLEGKRTHNFTVSARIDGKQKATVSVVPVGNDDAGRVWRYNLVIRPFRSRRTYTLPLSVVAEMVAWRVAKLEHWADERANLLRKGKKP